METTSCRRGCSGVAVGPNRWRNDCSRTASMYLRADEGELASCSTSVAAGGVALMVASVAVQGWTPACGFDAIRCGKYLANNVAKSVISNVTSNVTNIWQPRGQSKTEQ